MGAGGEGRGGGDRRVIEGKGGMDGRRRQRVGREGEGKGRGRPEGDRRQRGNGWERVEKMMK